MTHSAADQLMYGLIDMYLRSKEVMLASILMIYFIYEHR